MITEMKLHQYRRNINLINEGARLIESDPYKSQKTIGRVLSIEPGISEGWFNLAIALHEQRKIESAIKAYEIALERSNKPLKEARNNLAQDLLLSGNMKEGWKLYEQRLDISKTNFQVYDELYGTAWRGFKDNRKCTHLQVIAEQGLGDTIQFCRLMKLLEQKNIKASLFCQDSLVSLLRSSTTIKSVKLSLKNHVKHTRWCALMSLPYILELDVTEDLNGQPYIQLDEKHIEKWRSKFKRKKKHKLIGIHWQGNPDFEKKTYSKGRSIPYKYFKKLSEIENVEFLSLQKGKGKEQMESNIGLRFVDGQKEFDETMNFEDTAGALANCDLLISADSSVVHLAGAMGIPVWVLLKWVPEWRWGLSSSKSIWYNSARLLRQTRKNDWEGVMSVVKDELINSLQT